MTLYRISFYFKTNFKANSMEQNQRNYKQFIDWAHAQHTISFDKLKIKADTKLSRIRVHISTDKRCGWWFFIVLVWPSVNFSISLEFRFEVVAAFEENQINEKPLQTQIHYVWMQTTCAHSIISIYHRRT